MIGADGSQLGIMTSSDALALAEEKDLDLVKIAPNAVPPVSEAVTNTAIASVLFIIAWDAV